MGVDHGGVHISVPHQLLDRADVLSTLQQMGSEGVTEGMRRGGLMDAARQHGPAHGAALARPIRGWQWDISLPAPSVLSRN